jgi:hypothetical protein
MSHVKRIFQLTQEIEERETEIITLLGGGQPTQPQEPRQKRQYTKRNGADNEKASDGGGVVLNPDGTVFS